MKQMKGTGEACTHPHTAGDNTERLCSVARRVSTENNNRSHSEEGVSYALEQPQKDSGRTSSELELKTQDQEHFKQGHSMGAHI